MQVVVVGNQLCVGGNHHVIVDGNASARHHQTSAHNHHIPANLHLVGTHEIERRQHHASLTDISFKKFFYQLIVFIGVGHRVIDAEYQFHVTHTTLHLLGSRLSGVNSECFHHHEVILSGLRLIVLRGQHLPPLLRGWVFR